MSYRLGVDVGGTNTDAAILDDQLRVIYTVKSHTTKDVQSGIFNAISKVIKESKIDKAKINYAMLGTTKSTNAIVERQGLDKVAYIRIAKPASVGIPPYMEWPEELHNAINLEATIISGGYEFDGRKIAELNRSEVDHFCSKVKGKTKSIAIAGTFSPVNPEQEEKVAQWVREDLGTDIEVTLSNQIGGIGMLERENAAILNAALMTIGREIVDGFEDALSRLGINAQTFFSQNDGTLMTGEFTQKYPIFTIGCGPTNSIRGAYHLSGVKNALVLDVGGTTSDIGVLVNSFPRQSSISATVGGVETNFRMPDVMSIGIGGGTIIHKSGESFKVGPDSVGYEIVNKAKVFGGDVETASDDAAKLKRAFKESYHFVNDISFDWASGVIEKINAHITQSLDQMKVRSGDVPLILTGGGSFLIDSQIPGISKVYRPDHYDAANAVGAALGQVSGDINRIYSFEGKNKDDVIEDAKSEAINSAISAGADPETVDVIDIDIIPLAYLPGSSSQVKIKAVGNLQLH
ncbi:acetophenone carboxylase gamma subunit [Lentilactobacillus sunkii]|jgi:N-methylhydantoinase A/oxoprolinase/acetone carboxylase beta subunit|uniref:Acetophenone carboxylase gamma subunit n=1 Tax=Lentilactobacillus sunkii TaxID=481719 RepID=A0A1E7XJ13_9LACO|nr:hydantoinase/oxoprolinase family protein [Lentilactobacillus sunkii]OFA13104.1 acetophenone carboxylase gamma subunit [Lentilactobacillus sunkii]